ncbi:retroviral-like aspartic protease family protein [Roseomonas elaeocarpi]|uniref:Retroviral-like aspartic protease family protein n=1 Tax=Roseomonas elaeocarpi TaxID=907779 RepID=A0ABV6JR97_9PROT
MPSNRPVTALRHLAILAVPALLVGCAAPCDYGTGNTLPVHESASLPVVPVSLNDHRAPFLLDTGATTTTLLPEGAKALGLQTDQLRSTRSIGIGGETRGQNVLLARLRVGSQEVRQLTLPVAGHTTGEGQRRLAGLLGADFLRINEVDLDIPGRQVVLHDQRRCVAGDPPWSGSYDTLPLQVLSNGWLRLDVRINNRTLPALLDTGAAGSLVSPDTARELGAPEAVLSGPPAGRALGIGTEEMELRAWRNVTLEVGQDRLEGVTLGIATLPEDLPFKVILGQDYLGSRHLWISYATRRLFVQRQPVQPRRS